MGFKQERARLIQALQDGDFSIAERNNIDVKNFLSTGAISEEKLIELLKQASGEDYETAKLHEDPTCEIHILKIKQLHERWYIKWYFLETCTIISVHPIEK